MVRIRLRLIVTVTTSAIIYFVFFPHNYYHKTSSISLLGNWGGGPATQRSINARQVLQVPPLRNFHLKVLPPHRNVSIPEAQIISVSARTVVKTSSSPLFSQYLTRESAVQHFSKHMNTVNASKPEVDVDYDSLGPRATTVMNIINEKYTNNDDNNTDFVDGEYNNEDDAQEISNNIVSINDGNPIDLFKLDALPENEFVEGENEERTYDDYDDYEQRPEPPDEETKRAILKKSGDAFLLDGEMVKKGQNMKIEPSSESPPTIEVPDEQYIPESLQERSKLFPNSSEVCSFLAEQMRRVQHVQEVCRKYQISALGISRPGMAKPTGLISDKNIILDRRESLAFCPVYKSASTSWSINLMQLKGVWEEGMKIQPLLRSNFAWVANSAAPTVTQNTTRFMIVRHPFERLLSCYRDKFEDAKKDYYYVKYGQRMVRMYRDVKGMTREQKEIMLNEIEHMVLSRKRMQLINNPFANPPGPTFSEFVNYITSARHDDEHWRPVHQQCSPCHINYDFIIRFEHLQPESYNFIEYLNRTEQIKPRWDNPTKGGATTTAIACSYFSQLSRELVDKLVHKYKKDFDLFQYSPSDYIKCSQHNYNSINHRKER